MTFSSFLKYFSVFYFYLCLNFLPEKKQNMIKTLKYSLIFIIISLTLAMSVAYWGVGADTLTGKRIIGVCVLAFSFIFMPLFIYYRYRNKTLEDFRWKSTKENTSE